MPPRCRAAGADRCDDRVSGTCEFGPRRTRAAKSTPADAGPRNRHTTPRRATDPIAALAGTVIRAAASTDLPAGLVDPAAMGDGGPVQTRLPRRSRDARAARRLLGPVVALVVGLAVAPPVAARPAPAGAPATGVDTRSAGPADARPAPPAAGPTLSAARVAGLAGTPGARWRAPIAPPIVVRPFAPPPRPWLPGHRGVDLRAEPARLVRAAGDGVVSFAGTLAGRGVVVVDHGRLRTTYEPVLAMVDLGQRVSVGSVIGVIVPGAGHCGTGRCLHLGLKRGREYLDPMLVIGRTRAILVAW